MRKVLVIDYWGQKVKEHRLIVKPELSVVRSYITSPDWQELAKCAIESRQVSCYQRNGEKTTGS